MRAPPRLVRNRTVEAAANRSRPLLRRVLIPLLALALVYAAWPYVAVWRLNRALTEGDQSALAALVDLRAIRNEITRKINKDRERDSSIDGISDDFIDWLEHGIRRDGTDTLERLVTLDWVRASLLSKSTPTEGFLPVLSRAFFDGPGGFSLRIGAADAAPVFVRLRLGSRGWRVSALYY